MTGTATVRTNLRDLGLGLGVQFLQPVHKKQASIQRQPKLPIRARSESTCAGQRAGACATRLVGKARTLGSCNHIKAVRQIDLLPQAGSDAEIGRNDLDQASRVLVDVFDQSLGVSDCSGFLPGAGLF